MLAHMLANLLFILGDGMNALFGTAGGVIWLVILLVSSAGVMVMVFKKNPIVIETTLLQG